MIEAIVKTLEGGYSYDKEKAAEAGFRVGDRFGLKSVSMGQSHTNIYLKELSGGFNSIYFRFEEDNKPLDIYKDGRFNPYL